MGTITRSFANNITSGGTFDATDLTGTIPASNIADASVGNITDVPALVATTTVSSDPPSPDVGQIWYNTTDKALRAYVAGAGAWATGGNVNTGRAALAAAGTTEATLAFGGYNGSTVANTESYDGTSWTEVNDLNSGRYIAGAGTQTSALGFGGFTTAEVGLTESWNGTSWTEVADLNTSRYYNKGTGADNTNALTFGGVTPTVTGNTESWNGTSWTEVADLNTARRSMGTAGASNTSALTFAGNTPPGTNIKTENEEWNGTSWTELNDMNTGRYDLAGNGSVTSALAFAGILTSTRQVLTEEWNGTSWSEVADLPVGKSALAGAGTSNAAGFSISGETETEYSTATEEWSLPEVVTDLGVS